MVLRYRRLSKDIDRVVKSVKPAPEDGEGIGKILRDLKEKGEMSKRELITQRWGSGIKFTPYRRALMKHPNVSDRRQRIPTYVWVEKKDEI